MKKIILTTFTFAILTASILSCESEQSEKSSNQESLYLKSDSKEITDRILNDENFKNIIKDYDSVFNLQKDLVKLKTVMDKLETLSPEANLSEADKESFALSLGFKNFTDYHNFYELQKNRFKILNSDYGFTDSFTEGERIDIINIGFDNYIESYGTHCQRRRRNCLMRAHATAVLEHLACASVDITVIAGAICHGAVYILHESAVDDCQLDYQDCISA